MGGITVEFKEIKELIEIIDKSQLRVFELNHNGAIIKMSKNTEAETSPSVATPSLPASIEIASQRVKEEIYVREEIKEAETVKGNTIKAPIVGTFYASPAPDKDDFVKVGDSVKKGDVVCIVEAMKVMNEVVSEFDGVIKAVLAENEVLVEYGQPLFIVG